MPSSRPKYQPTVEDCPESEVGSRNNTIDSYEYDLTGATGAGPSANPQAKARPVASTVVSADSGYSSKSTGTGASADSSSSSSQRANSERTIVPSRANISSPVSFSSSPPLSGVASRSKGSTGTSTAASSAAAAGAAPSEFKRPLKPSLSSAAAKSRSAPASKTSMRPTNAMPEMLDPRRLPPPINTSSYIPEVQARSSRPYPATSIPTSNPSTPLYYAPPPMPTSRPNVQQFYYPQAPTTPLPAAIPRRQDSLSNRGGPRPASYHVGMLPQTLRMARPDSGGHWEWRFEEEEPPTQSAPATPQANNRYSQGGGYYEQRSSISKTYTNARPLVSYGGPQQEPRPTPKRRPTLSTHRENDEEGRYYPSEDYGVSPTSQRRLSRPPQQRLVTNGYPVRRSSQRGENRDLVIRQREPHYEDDFFYEDEDDEYDYYDPQATLKPKRASSARPNPVPIQQTKYYSSNSSGGVTSERSSRRQSADVSTFDHMKRRQAEAEEHQAATAGRARKSTLVEKDGFLPLESNTTPLRKRNGSLAESSHDGTSMSKASDLKFTVDASGTVQFSGDLEGRQISLEPTADGGTQVTIVEGDRRSTKYLQTGSLKSATSRTNKSIRHKQASETGAVASSSERKESRKLKRTTTTPT